MRIWYISKYVTPPGSGSVGSRGYHLMRELAARGHDVTVITSTSNHLSDTPDIDSLYRVDHRDGIRLLWIRTLPFTGAKSIRRVLSWLHFEAGVLRVPSSAIGRPDIVIASSLSLFTVLSGLVLRRRHGARFVFEVRDIWPLTIVEEGGFSRKNLLVRSLGAIERLGYKRADAIVGTMPNLGEHVREVVGAERVAHCIPMGYVEQPDSVCELPDAYKDAMIPEGKILIGYAGTIGITNALDALFEAAAALKDDPTIHFVIVGDGDLRRDYQQRYSHLRNITFVGRVPRESIPRVLDEFDILYFSTFPSRVWKFGQSLNKVIDYMLAGKPIVGSFSGYPSMIDEADAGVLVPSGDGAALVREFTRLAHDVTPAERDEIGRRGAAWIRQNRNYSELASEYESLLKSLM